jgi:hypothetical protein
MMFFIDKRVIKIKESTLEKISKLVDQARPPGFIENGSFVEIGLVCEYNKKSHYSGPPHHKLRIAE